MARMLFAESRFNLGLIMLQLLCLAITLCSAKSLSTSTDFSAQVNNNHLPLSLRRPRGMGDSTYVKFNLFTNTTANCTAGLTHNGVFVKMEYRLLKQESLGKWITVNTGFELEPSDESFNRQDREAVLSQVMSSDTIQFRIVQPEHGGGACNCWGVRDFFVVFPSGNRIPVNRSCDDSDSKDCMFCGGSASVPRGVVSDPVYLGQNPDTSAKVISNVPRNLIDSKQTPVCKFMTDCDPDKSWIELQFMLGLILENCEGIDNLDEGVEVAMGNWENDGQWIPLAFYAPNSTRSKKGISVGKTDLNETNCSNGTVNIRGYQVPLFLMGQQGPFPVSLSVCDKEFVSRDGLQFRWLQTAYFHQDSSLGQKDVWTLDDVSVTLHVNNTYSQTVLTDNFNTQFNVSNWSDARNVNVALPTNFCNEHTDGEDDQALIFGECDTFGCGMTDVVSSRLVSTVSLSVTSFYPKEPPVDPSKNIENLATLPVNESNYVNISTTVSDLLAKFGSNDTFQTVNNLANVAITFQNIANFINGTDTVINDTAVRNMVLTLNSLLVWDSETLSDANSSSIVRSFESVTSKFAQQEDANVPAINIMFTAELDKIEDLRRDGKSSSFDERVHMEVVHLPSDLFDGNTFENQSQVGITFVIYELPHFFPVKSILSSDINLKVGTVVVAATVGSGMSIRNLTTPVTVKLVRQDLGFIRIDSEKCVSWDFEANNGEGGWTDAGCKKLDTDDENMITCECNHLTNFAVLVDGCTRTQNCTENPVLQEALSIITKIGVVFSCVGLTLTVLTLLIFKKLRNQDISKYHIQLSIAMFCMLVVFSAGIDKTEVYVGCIVVSMLIHYFTLVAILWMGAEALLMFQKLVLVFTTITKRFIVILSIVCWLVPLVPVLIPMIIDVAGGTDVDSDLIIYRRMNETESVVGNCFLKDPGVFFGAFLGPIFIVILFNLVIFCCVVLVLIRHTRNTSKRKNSLAPATVARLIASITGIMSILGLPWLFAALTYRIGNDDTLRYIFQTLFTLSVSFQGFFVFVFFCVLNKVARELWKELLCCGKYRSKVLHPETYSLSKSNKKTNNTEVFTLRSDPTPTHTATQTPSPSPIVEKQMDECENKNSVMDITWVENGDSEGNVQCGKETDPPN